SKPPLKVARPAVRDSHPTPNFPARRATEPPSLRWLNLGGGWRDSTRKAGWWGPAWWRFQNGFPLRPAGAGSRPGSRAPPHSSPAWWAAAGGPPQIVWG